MRNGMVAKSKRHRNLRSRKETRFIVNVTDEEKDDPMGSNSSFNKTNPQTERDDDDDVTVENIAERIKRRKENAEKKTLESESESNASKRGRTATKKKVLFERIEEIPVVDQATLSTSQESTEVDRNSMNRIKRRKKSRSSQNNAEDLEKNNLSTDAVAGLRKSARNLTRISSMASESDGARNKSNSKFNYDSPPESCDETDECAPKNNVDICVGKLLSDEEVIEEQQRIERLLLQEREDFELARRLQAQYDEMERVAGRTRRSRQVIERERDVDVNLREMRTVRKMSGVRKTAKRKPIVGRVVSTATKEKRGRPKRMKITVDTREDETRTR